jgi:putative copper resistance protein D
LYTGVVVGTHLTPFQQNALLQHGLHVLEELLYLASGYLLLLLVLGGEPLRRTLSHLLRVVVLLAGMVVDTIVGITLMMTPSEPFPAYGRISRTWGSSLIDDLHLGGAIMWVGGDLLMAALAIVVITHWVNSPTRGNDLGPWLEAARRSAVGASEGADDIDDDEDALRAYNAMLSRLANGERDDPDR